MNSKRIVHVVGMGTIGEPLIGLRESPGGAHAQNGIQPGLLLRPRSRSIRSQTVVPVNTVALKDTREVIGFSFTLQDGNSLLSSIAAAEWFLYPEDYEKRLSCVEKHMFEEI
jgi:hypothetical protein